MNKKIKLSMFAFAIFITIFGVFGAASKASAMTCNSATIYSTNSTYSQPVSAYFAYGTDSNAVSSGGGMTTPSQTIEPGSSISQFLSGLSESTTYYYKLIVPSQSASTSVNSFMTPACSVQPTQVAPTVTLVANPTTVPYNGSSILSWNSTNATSCNVSGGNWSGSQNISGTWSTGDLTSGMTYYITCTGSTGLTATANATVSVGSNNICTDSTAENYGSSLPCTYYTNNICRDTTAENYGGTLPCIYYTNYNICRDTTAENYGSAGACIYYPVTQPIYTQPIYTQPIYTQPVYTQPANNSLNVVTNSATQITDTSAQLNSLIGSSATDPITAWFEWGPTIDLGNTTNTTSLGSLPSVIHTDTLTGLSEGTTYYFRAVAEDSSITTKGAILSFTTGGARTTTVTYTPRTGSAVVLVTSSVNRDQPIVPTLDNTRPHPGDEVNYTIDYQNVGNASVTNLTLQTTLPDEVEYISSVPTNPTINGSTLIFNLGTLHAGASGQVTVKTQVLESATPGTFLNFPATLSYVDPSGNTQSANATVTAQVYSPDTGTTSNLGAFVFGSGFFPTNVFGWLLLLILILILIMLIRYLYGRPMSRQTTTTTTNVPQKPMSKKTTTTTVVQQ